MEEQWAPIGTQPGWIDPHAGVKQERWVPPAVPQASLRARVLSVVIDFALLKLFTTAFVILFAGGAIFLELAGRGSNPTVSTGIVLGANAVAAVLLYVVFPIRRRGQTVGRRMAGVGPRLADGRTPVPWRRVGRHDLLVFAVPAFAFDPIDVIGWREIVVLGLWVALQVARDPDGRTPPERAFGIWMFRIN